MDNRSVNVNNSTVNNANLNAGDYVTQSLKSENVSDEMKEIFLQLYEEIKAIPDEDDKQDAIEDAGKLEAAVSDEKFERAKKLFGRLPGFIQASKAGVELASSIAKLFDSAPQ
ncbi:hypothetical protein [Priestia megaterium]|uniref:hypothetical protein n=1 Tax=Priestia megaterium TaxID=1404 RepID=UPI002E21C071|nr:hypothetical protein [Priestia megaterium]